MDYMAYYRLPYVSDSHRMDASGDHVEEAGLKMEAA